MQFNWDDSFSVHNSKMDRQHKQLIEYINAFYDAADSGNYAQCIASFDKVISFTTYHFADEERLMEAKGYPLLERHKMIHVELVNKVTELQEKLIAKKPGAEQETKIFLKNWLTAHIKGIDMKYSDYLNDQPAKQSA